MKKKLSKKLILNKNKISRLNDKEMYLVRGASMINFCTESCPALFICCDSKTIPVEENRAPAKAQG